MLIDIDKTGWQAIGMLSEILLSHHRDDFITIEGVGTYTVRAVMIGIRRMATDYPVLLHGKRMDFNLYVLDASEVELQALKAACK